MVKKEIEISVKSNVTKTTQDVNNLNTSMKQAGNTAEEMNTKLSGSERVSKGIGMVGDAVGKLNPALGGAIKGADGLIAKMWQMAANPLGAILAAIVITLKFLYEAFQSSVAGGKEIKAVFAGITAVGNQVKDAIFGLGRALINTIDAAIKFIKLDFKGAAESMKKANKEAATSYRQLGDAVDVEFNFKVNKYTKKDGSGEGKFYKNDCWKVTKAENIDTNQHFETVGETKDNIDLENLPF